MNFLQQGFQKLEHKQHGHTDPSFRGATYVFIRRTDRRDRTHYHSRISGW